MKLVSFNCTIEISKDKDTQSTHRCYVDVTDKGVNISHPYVSQPFEQAMVVNKLVQDFVAFANEFNTRIDNFNRANGLEEYAPHVLTTKKDVSDTPKEDANND